jgi:hypothetical protein
VKFDITASWTNLAKWIKVTFHSSPFCFGQPSFVQMRLTKLLSMLPNYSSHYTAASLFFWLVISGSVYNEKKPMWTCKQAINYWMHIPEPTLSMDWLINSRICWRVFLPLWNWETLYTQSLYLQYGKEYVRWWAIIMAWVFTNWLLLELCIFMTASIHSVIEVSILFI